MKRRLAFANGLVALLVAACSETDRAPDATGGAAGSGAGTAGSAGSGAGKGGSAGSSAGSGGAAGSGAGRGGSAGHPETGGSAGTGAVGGVGGDGGAAGSDAGSAGDGAGSGGAGASGAGGSGGSGADPRWAACPTAEAFEDDGSWPDTLEVTGTGVYCAKFDETRTLKEELAKKALLRVTPGSYRLPAREQEGLALPVCIAFGEDGVGVPAVPRSTTHQATSTSGRTSHRYTFVSEQPDPARRLTIDLYLSLPDGEAPGFVLNGDAPDPFGPTEPSNGFILFESLEESAFVDRGFDSCTHESSRLNHHEIAFDDGELALDVRIGQSFASTEPAAFVGASGTFRGVPFEQADYFKLVYRPAHHHFERDFAVLFDEPIEGACGIQILAFPADPEGVPPTAATVDCALDPVETLDVQSFTLTRDPP
jgi:hypothetical protein